MVWIHLDFVAAAHKSQALLIVYFNCSMRLIFSHCFKLIFRISMMVGGMVSFVMFRHYIIEKRDRFAVWSFSMQNWDLASRVMQTIVRSLHWIWLLDDEHSHGNFAHILRYVLAFLSCSAMYVANALAHHLCYMECFKSIV